MNRLTRVALFFASSAGCLAVFGCLPTVPGVGSLLPQAITFETPTQNEMIAGGTVNYQVTWYAPGLSGPKFQLLINNADGSPFRTHDIGAHDLGNGHYRGGWTVGHYSPGSYQLVMRDKNSGASGAVTIQVE